MKIRRLCCALVGHRLGKRMYVNDVVDVIECSRCRAPVVIFQLAYHMHRALEGDGTEEVLQMLRGTR